MYLGAGEMPLERAIRERRFAYGVDAEARKMRQPPGTLALDSMPSALVEQFRRAFLSADRPQAREWVERLDELAKALKRCDLHSGHYYYRELSYCPWCGIEKQARVRLFNFLLSGDDSKRGLFRLDEIWKEIERVKAPDLLQNYREKILKAPEPSVDVASHEQNLRIHFTLAIMVSIAAGLLIPIYIGFPFAFFLLILSGLVACAIGKTGRSSNMQLLFQNRQTAPDNPLLEEAKAVWRQAKEAEHLLREQYDREAGNERWRAKHDELRSRKDTYENLAQIRQTRLHQLEAEARQHQLGEFLDQFKINDANLDGISPTIKTDLLSHGVETAADLIEEVKQIPSVGHKRAKWLLEWRRGLEKKFVFDPARDVLNESRIRTEKELDGLRFRLESELIGGAHYLRLVKQEIENSRENLHPALTQARQELAQAEKDLEVASKRNSAGSIISALILAFIVGLLIGPSPRPRSDANSGANTSGENSGARPAPPPPNVAVKDQPPATKEKMQEAIKIFHEAERLSKEERFADAVGEFQKVINIDPKFNSAYEGLGYALYRLDMYEESVAASNSAIKIYPDFKPYYNLGLAQFAAKNWPEAILAFQRGIELRDPTSWKDEYTQAYYYLGLSLEKMGEIHKAIQELEAEPGFLDGVPINRFKLAIFYLCAGWKEAAKEQHRLLKNSDAALARELNKLINKHGKRT
jgi:tetratricopeptide (TPR) repeat protein